MEYQSTKLDIYIDPSFIIRFFNANYNNDEEIHYKSSFKREILMSEKRIFLLNGEEIPIEEYNRQIASLDSQKIYPDKKIIFKEVDYKTIKNPFSIFLTNYTDKDIDKSKKSGFLFFNTTKIKWINDYKKLSLDCRFCKTFEVKPDNETSEQYDYDDYTEHSLPTNNILLIDPWMATWDMKKIKQNIFKLFKKLFFINDSDTINRIKIISLIDTQPNSRWNPAKPKKIEKEIQNYFSPRRFNIEIIYINKYLFYEMKNGKKEKKDSVVEEYHDLFEIIDKYFHDRLIISNYIYYQSGRSLDVNMKINNITHQYECIKYSSVDLFSLLNQSKLKQVNTYNDIYNQIYELKKLDGYKKFFEQ